MAKTTKGGLGRGLGSLMGGTFETNAPTTPSPEKERVTVDADSDEPIKTGKPTNKTSSQISKEGATGKTTTSKEKAVEQTDSSKTKEAKETESTKTESSASSDSQKLSSHLKEVPIDSVVPNPNQPRTNFQKDEIKALAASIEKDGLLEPILVRLMPDDTYQIIAGERRWQACKLAGLKKVLVRIKDIDEGKALELSLIENLQRSDLNPIEEAYGYKRLMEREHMTQAEVAQAMSKARSTITNTLRLLDLPEAAQQLLFEDKITAGHARVILSLPSREDQLALTKKLMEDKLSVREAEAYARTLAHKGKSQETSRQQIPDTYKTVAKELHDALKTNVRVRTSKGVNRIEIEFKNEKELEKLFEKLTASDS